MTSNEIDKCVETLLSLKDFLEVVSPSSARADFEKELKRLCRSLVVQAYENVEQHVYIDCACGVMYLSGESHSPKCLVQRMRLLKHSLVAELVSS